ncbi:Glyoxalase-like domain protein [Pseudobythopirellula maris]|uniref:Glyoxalase-like domain protein n=1 Tax=Pseudobythopirellula maris TaxID=2527991 RepID=A0A5C5ZLL5_9BACT|nr:VOC family protein [Pseudobythopirellula maris]TWT88342.1 Glyoxalase-like domain protein [Pseudobythopirellula maris]
MPVDKIPAGYSTVTPYLVVKDTAAALAFYAKAFGAEEQMRLNGPGGSVDHAETKIGDSLVMIGPSMPGKEIAWPQGEQLPSISMLLYVEDCETLYAQAIAAGCESRMEPVDMFWGDRMAKVADPFGHEWSMATHIEDVTQEECQRRYEAMLASVDS